MNEARCVVYAANAWLDYIVSNLVDAEEKIFISGSNIDKCVHLYVKILCKTLQRKRFGRWIGQMSFKSVDLSQIGGNWNWRSHLQFWRTDKGVLFET